MTRYVDRKISSDREQGDGVRQEQLCDPMGEPNAHLDPVDQDRLTFLSTRGYRLIRLLCKHRFVGLFSFGEEQVVIKVSVYRETEHEASRLLLERCPTAPVVRTITTFPVHEDDPLVRCQRNAGYVVMDYVPGSTLGHLASLTKREPAMLDRFVRMINHLVDLLAQTGFHHGDLYFGNIITNDDLDTATLIDFERSQLFSDPQQRERPIWEDIVCLIDVFYDDYLFLPEELQNLCYYDIHQALPLKEDLAYVRRILDRFTNDFLS